MATNWTRLPLIIAGTPGTTRTVLLVRAGPSLPKPRHLPDYWLIIDNPSERLWICVDLQLLMRFMTAEDERRCKMYFRV